MKKNIVFGLILFTCSSISTVAQSNQDRSDTDSPKVIVTNRLPPPRTISTPSPVPIQQREEPDDEARKTIIVGQAQPDAASQGNNLNFNGLSFSVIKNKISEAKRQMQSRPLTIGSSEPVNGTDVTLIRIAFYDPRSGKIDSIVMSKEQFLTPDSPVTALSDGGRPVRARTIRGNGVNTPVEITGNAGEHYLPLVVQYPRENRGVYSEMAYYVSTHPGIITPEVVNAGRYYVHNVIDIARERLQHKGYFTQPKVADIAERLATVEHVDHFRFRTEFHANIYNDIFTLYALNEGQTYRYSVSSAGAGGMVQMIPSTYRMIRGLYPNAGLMPDFVEGMRNHVNATEAMLLYMQMTWNELNSSETVRQAMADGIATQEQLMAAGYNSNPSRLPGYIKRGGQNWTSLIPNETKIYLQIWDSLERFVPMEPRRK